MMNDIDPNEAVQQIIDRLKAIEADEPGTASWAVNEIANAFQLPLLALDPDLDERLGDLATAFIDLFGELAMSSDSAVRANLPRRANALTRMLQAELDEMAEREDLSA